MKPSAGEQKRQRRRKMAIHVKSEIGKLKKVMLHRPGQELEHLVPEL